jgi:hypothetical protein
VEKLATDVKSMENLLATDDAGRASAAKFQFDS